VVIIAAEPSRTRPGAVVLRLQNLSDEKRLANITLPAVNLEASEVDFRETAVGAGKLTVTGNRLEVEVGGHATVSILLSRPVK
jgi:hypothetical protein